MDLLRYILYTCPKSIVMNLTTCTHGAHKIYTAVRLLKTCLTTCTHGAHKIHSCKNKGVHTAKPFRVYRTRPLAACTDEAPDRVYKRGRYPCDAGQNHPHVLATLAQNHPRVLATPRKRVHSRPPDLKIGHPKRKLVFQPFIFGCKTVSFRESKPMQKIA